MVLFNDSLVVVRGGGDLASGVIYRLHRAGFPVVVTELPQPQLIRRTVCYGAAAYDVVVEVEDIIARRVSDAPACLPVLENNEIPVILDAAKQTIETLKPVVVVDARMQKRNSDTTLEDAPLVIALGPGYTAGQDCHVIIETNRGHFLGRTIYLGSAIPDTGKPGIVANKSTSRVLRAPSDGTVVAVVEIGESLTAGQVIASVNGETIRAPFSGVLRGLVHPALPVTKGMKIGDVDPRAKREHCFFISDKALAVGGGVLEAVFSASQVRRYWNMTE